jgi:NitT/TauT family transport system ATP-binding protein
MAGLRNICKSFKSVDVFIDFSIRFNKNHINCILGPSGCGKTTLLNIIAGLLSPDSGSVFGFDREKISYVFQEPRLLPWKSVRKNIEFTLTGKFQPEKVSEITDNYLGLVDLRAYQNFLPGQLSGGMKQRVSLARAFSFPSAVILMDEPFKGLDYKLKQNLQNSFMDLWKQDRRTVVYVTHDIEEAIEIGDEIFLLSRHPVKILKTFRKDQLSWKGQNKQMIIDLME